MKANRVLLLVISTLLIFLIIGGCKSKEDLQKEEQIRAKAEQVALKHFKENYNVDVVFTEYDIMPSYVSSTVWFKGYIEGKKDKEVSIYISYITFEVSTASIPREYMINQ